MEHPGLFSPPGPPYDQSKSIILSNPYVLGVIQNTARVFKAIGLILQIWHHQTFI